jgi:hypothetical protein
MRYLHSVAIWTAALFAALATGRIVALLSGADARAQVLISAEAAATTGAASLLLSVLVVYLLTRRQPRLKLAPWGATRKLPAGDCDAGFHKRREVLEQRLNVDEPRLCSQYMIACTAWSFCAGSEGKDSAGEGTPAQAQKLIRVFELPPQAQGLPLVHRNGMDNCPFRFASPCARSSSAR